MHPFSLKKEHIQAVTGGKPDMNVTHSTKESGDPITLSIPEDGYDPRPEVM
ncbi:hypothetical protein [Thalassomonas actiniarum]|uniref:Uncharacterized protein n=1 Tax=Thalassomonas actiniarum TaxID=485447 RepID=A0AAE9YRZ6_9GAMM|nr:hypothetical protein [Thalassomonas actiniarum]WDD99194.1 hypothetical protein SG35_000445 [Thalassomonas actiniarum]